MNRKKKVAVLISGIALIGLFLITYNYVSNEISKGNKAEDQTVYNEGEKALKDDLVIALSKNGKTEKMLTLSDFKKEYGVEKSLTEENVKEILKEQGYEIDQKTDTVFTFKSTGENKTKFEKNTYYIGEANEYFAIYKSDDKGEISEVPVKTYDLNFDLVRLRPEEYEKIRNKTYFSSKSLDEVLMKMENFD